MKNSHDANIKSIYQKMHTWYGHQGWWPLIDYMGSNPTKTGSISGYHPGNYSLPETTAQVFEICIGAVLTQGVGWTNVEKALLNIRDLGALCPCKIIDLDANRIREAIRPTGYFNQKARKLTEFARFFIDLGGRKPTRENLLSIWGIGKETADSILLYAYKEPVFVVDTYTKRIFSSLGLIDGREDYDRIRTFIENSLEPDYRIYQEFHALIVEHAKRYYSKKNNGINCPLR